MSSNNQHPLIPGLVRSMANQWENRDALNPVQATLNILDVLPDRNSSLVAQPSSAPALGGEIKRWESRSGPRPAQHALVNTLPNSESTLVRRNSQPSISQVQTNLGTFTRFSELPKEIRLMIWEYTIPPAQRLYIKSNKMKHDKLHSRRNPAILHVNYESREIAKKHLTLLFGGVNMIGSEQFKYFNPTLDTIYFDGLPQKLRFSLGPYPPSIHLLNQEPMQECDNIHDIVIRKKFMTREGPTPNFRNLDRVRLVYARSRSVRFDADLTGRRAFVRSIFIEYQLDIGVLSAFFKHRRNWGLISRLPRIYIILSRADMQALRSTGTYAEANFGKDLHYLTEGVNIT